MRPATEAARACVVSWNAPGKERRRTWSLRTVARRDIRPWTAEPQEWKQVCTGGFAAEECAGDSGLWELDCGSSWHIDGRRLAVRRCGVIFGGGFVRAEGNMTMKSMKSRRSICCMAVLGVFLLGPNFTAAQTPSPALLVLEKSDNSLAIVDPANLRIVSRVPAGPDPHEIVTSADGKLAYISNYGVSASPLTPPFLGRLT